MGKGLVNKGFLEDLTAALGFEGRIRVFPVRRRGTDKCNAMEAGDNLVLSKNGEWGHVGEAQKAAE